MAQTAPPPPGAGIPRPLPRGGRPTRSRDTRPRFQPLDGLWVALLSVVFVFFGLTRHAGPVSLVFATGTIVLTYLTGWRAAGRPSGVIAGLLLATSASFVASVSHAPGTALFALMTLGALFAFVAGSSLAALSLAAVAVWIRADGLMLGLMLMTFTLIQHRRRAWIGALLFFLPALAALVFPQGEGGQRIPSVTFGYQSGLLTWLAAPAALVVSWFLLPFLGEIADPVRRARWMPIVVWTALYAVIASTVTAAGPAAAVAPFLPLWFLLIGTGLARLLPVMTGDLPIPWLRYAVATLAVLSLIAIRTRVEWIPGRPATMVHERPPVLSPPAPPASLTPHPSASHPAHAAPAALTALKPVPVRPTVPRKFAKPKPVKAAKPLVRQYVVKNGRLVRRSKWAIQWDLTHPHP